MNCIVFSADGMLRISAVENWNGTIEYSYDNVTWNEWDGSEIFNNIIYMRGVNNKYISYGNAWVLNGKNVRCQGNIENLLDYKLVQQNIHPKMGEYCFYAMFWQCENLISMPQLPMLQLADYCYLEMFYRCSSLTEVTELPATELAYCCYNYMFYDCSSLLTTPKFPDVLSTRRAIVETNSMFAKCTALQHVNIDNKSYNINILRLL